MQALSGWLLPRGTTVELNRDEYVKPGLLRAGAAYQTLYNIADPATGERAIYIDEIREAERFTNAAPTADPDRGSAAMTRHRRSRRARSTTSRRRRSRCARAASRRGALRRADDRRDRRPLRRADQGAVPRPDDRRDGRPRRLRRGADAGPRVQGEPGPRPSNGRSAGSTSFKPRDDRGLVAEIGPLRPTRDGDDALELAADGLLGASIGFAVLHPGDEKWSVDRRSRDGSTRRGSTTSR